MKPEPPIEALKALGHPARFAILQTLTGRERSVSEIEEASGITQPTLSQQLAVLRGASLVRTRKQGKLVYYRLDSDRFAALSASIAALAGKGTEGVRPASQPEPLTARRRTATGAANFARLL